MTRPGGTRRLSAAWSYIWMVAAGLHFAAPAWGQSAEFRRAVEQGHRDRLREVCPSCSPLELRLAEPYVALWEEAGPGYSARDKESACLLAARSALARGDAAAIMRAATSSPSSQESSPAGYAAQLLMTEGELLAGRFEEATSRADWLSRHASEPWKGWGLFAQGQCALASADTAEALRLFKLCTRLKSHEAAAPAYLELGRLYEARSDAEQAMRYLTMYRESFPRGLLPEFASVPGASSRADRAAGLEYSIQVGVFGDRANAGRLLERFQAEGFKGELKSKRVSGQNYTAVWIGRYRSQNEAQEARKTLEALFSESYRVMARE